MTTVTDYTTLQSVSADYLNRADLTSQIPIFVQMAEAKLNRELRVLDMLTTATPNASAETFSSPADYLEAFTLDITGTTSPTAPLRFVGPEEFREIKASQITGNTRYCTLIGSTFHLYPVPTATLALSLVYYARLPALASNSSNWLLVKSPDVYLYSTLLEAQPYLKDDTRLQTWAALRQQGLDAVTLESERSMRPRAQILAARKRSFG